LATLAQEQSYVNTIKAISDTLKWLAITIARLEQDSCKRTPPPLIRKEKILYESL